VLSVLRLAENPKVTATFVATHQMELVAFHIALRLNHVLWISLTRA
jgi:hypothetical protein